MKEIVKILWMPFAILAAFLWFGINLQIQTNKNDHLKAQIKDLQAQLIFERMVLKSCDVHFKLIAWSTNGFTLQAIP